ncbi:hypothetical protein AOLI_G00179580 [Acnodon oligacanthus]
MGMYSLCRENWQMEVWKLYHQAKGLAGTEKRYHYYWPQMEDEVKVFQSQSVSCGLQKGLTANQITTCINDR